MKDVFLNFEVKIITSEYIIADYLECEVVDFQKSEKIQLVDDVVKFKFKTIDKEDSINECEIEDLLDKYSFYGICAYDNVNNVILDKINTANVLQKKFNEENKESIKKVEDYIFRNSALVKNSFKKTNNHLSFYNSVGLTTNLFVCENEFENLVDNMVLYTEFFCKKIFVLDEENYHSINDVLSAIAQMNQGEYLIIDFDLIKESEYAILKNILDREIMTIELNDDKFEIDPSKINIILSGKSDNLNSEKFKNLLDGYFGLRNYSEVDYKDTLKKYLSNANYSYNNYFGESALVFFNISEENYDQLAEICAKNMVVNSNIYSFMEQFLKALSNVYNYLDVVNNELIINNVFYDNNEFFLEGTEIYAPTSDEVTRKRQNKHGQEGGKLC